MYKVGEIIFEILNIKKQQMVSGLKSFQCDKGTPEIIYSIKYVNDFRDHVDIKPEKIIYYCDAFVVQKIKEGYRKYYYVDNCVYAVTEEKQGCLDIYLEKDALDSEFHPYFLPSLFCMERTLIEKDSFILHSSYISLNNQGILFTAPSGGGKSTQADLWMKYKGAEILNGDKNIVGKKDGKWYVYGTPFSGSSRYCVNRTTPLNAIIILEKGLENKFQRLDLRGFAKIFSQTTVNPWDAEFTSKVMDLIMRVCSEVPVYLYSCTKEESAVNELYEILVKGGVLHGIRK